MASFLMIVGIIFIVVAGTVFVSTAWQYLPAAGKQGILLLSAVLLFTGSVRMAARGIMKKTETALYYLGTACLGLFTLSVCGELMGRTGGEGIVVFRAAGWRVETILMAGVVMLVPLILRFIKKRTIFDFMMTALLVDWIMFWFCISEQYEWFGCCVISAVCLTAYVLADHLRKWWLGENARLELVFIVLYILHGISYIVHYLLLCLVCIGEETWCNLFLLSLFTVGITEWMQRIRKHRLMQVCNSIALYGTIITGVNLGWEIMVSRIPQAGDLWNGELRHFLIYSLCVLCMAILARKEMICMTAVWGMLIPFSQIWHYGGHGILFSYMQHQVSDYVPFSGVLVLAWGFLLYRKSKDGGMDREQIWRYSQAAATQGMVMLVLLYASRHPFYDKGIYSLLLLHNLAIACLFQNRIARGCFRTCALFFGEVLLFRCSCDIISVDYEVEQFCLLAAAGLFLLSVIWDNYGYAMRTFQFVSMCLIMTVMLGNAVLLGGVGNALVLGVSGVSMLSCAAVFNSRRYAVLSSVVLILLAFYITRSFWSSIAWWVYLFAAGVVLVLLAVRKERKSAVDQ